jgi:hypothetical protein
MSSQSPIASSQYQRIDDAFASYCKQPTGTSISELIGDHAVAMIEQSARASGRTQLLRTASARWSIAAPTVCEMESPFQGRCTGCLIGVLFQLMTIMAFCLQKTACLTQSGASSAETQVCCFHTGSKCARIRNSSTITDKKSSRAKPLLKTDDQGALA